jgi:AcrR family transcriptional regulator
MIYNGFMAKSKHTPGSETRERILNEAVKLINKGGREALSTRSVAEAAEVQAPTLYRLFGDMRGLLDAVAEQGINSAFKKKKEFVPGANPVDDLRKLWEQHTYFGLNNPAVYSLIFGEPRPDHVSTAAEQAKSIMRDVISRIAKAGNLRVTEKRAAELVYAASSGAVLYLLNLPEDERDLSLAKDTCEAIIVAITTDNGKKVHKSPQSAAIALNASLNEMESLTAGEKLLLSELLEKIAVKRIKTGKQ